MGQDPKIFRDRRTARANAAAGHGDEHPADVAAYIEQRRQRAAARAIPTPGAAPSAPAEAPVATSEAVESAEAPAREASETKTKRANK